MSVDFKELWAEHEFVYEAEGLILAVNKLGGGTLGKEYTGQWQVVVYDVTGAWLEEFTVLTGMPHTHEWVAKLVAEDARGGA
jgi:uncharacterized Fe-S cluster-containing radical SAM superfamily protein